MFHLLILPLTSSSLVHTRVKTSGAPQMFIVLNQHL